jgi:hypothetical protein
MVGRPGAFGRQQIGICLCSGLADFLLGGLAAAVSMQLNTAAMTGDCQYRGLSPLMPIALMLLPVIGGSLSYRIARTSRDTITPFDCRDLMD